MVNLGLNLLVFLLWLAVGAILLARYMERRGLEYKLLRTENGLSFTYRLGVYAGRIELIRDSVVTAPQLVLGVNGWECKFPSYYTLKEMCAFLGMSSNTAMKAASHSKDMAIFDEIVNRKNDALVSINGQIFTYDNSDHKPFFR